MSEDAQAADSAASKATAAVDLAAGIARAITTNNFALTYLARRCDTTTDEVERWTTGRRFPSRWQWVRLERESRDFVGLSGLRDEVAVEYARVHGWATATEEDVAPARPFRSKLDYRPSARVDATVTQATSPSPTPTEASERKPSPPPEASVPGATVDAPVPGSSVTAAGTTAVLDKPDMAWTVYQSTPEGTTVGIPSSYVVYPCKVSGRTIVQVALPRMLSLTDARRICAFVMTQVDDDTE